MTTTPDTTPATAERLLKLRAAVANAPLEQFDMSYWKCGTHSCAAGWYVRANPECGLKLYGDRETSAVISAVKEFSAQSASAILAKHFGLEETVSWDLFVNWDADDEDPAAQKAEFLAKLDALLAACGIAAPAEQPAVRRFKHAEALWSYVWCVDPATDEGWAEFADGTTDPRMRWPGKLGLGWNDFASSRVAAGTWIELDARGIAAPAGARAAEGATK